MAGTTVAAAKTALVAALKTLTAADQPLAGVQVEYSFPGRTLQRSCVYLGSAIGGVDLSAMRGSSGRIKRAERPVLELHIAVSIPGQGTTEATDAEACRIGAVIEEYFAANSDLGGVVSGLKLAAVVGEELDGGTDDDGAESVLTYQIQLTSMLA
jgi:hypothetical protein